MPGSIVGSSYSHFHNLLVHIPVKPATHIPAEALPNIINKTIFFIFFLCELERNGRDVHG
jgi:hypothetical protein